MRRWGRMIFLRELLGMVPFDSFVYSFNGFVVSLGRIGNNDVHWRRR